jgi:glycosyltransferase involved in cell wall biosynthesis
MNNVFAKVSIIIPCMNEEQYLTNLVRLIDQSISESFEKSDYEIIVVDDGSTDGTIEEAKALSNHLWKTHFKMKLIELRQNYGKDAAIISGVENADLESEFIIFIDADGEHPVNLIPGMYHEISGNDLIGQIVAYRIGSLGQSFFRGIGNFLYSRLSAREYNGGLETDFRIIRKYIMDEVASLIGNKVHLQSAISKQAPATQKVLFHSAQITSNNAISRKSRWSNLRLIDYAALSLLKGSDAILKPILILFSINLSAAGLLIFFTVVTSIQTGSRSGTATILVVQSLYFIMQVFMMFIGLMYLRLILVETQKKSRVLIKRISEVI